uniref:Uncharacterized protein n=1 Tax=Triticum urartu TaxID=4572 RepID=A0A8R7UJC3_TRIUA
GYLLFLFVAHVLLDLWDHGPLANFKKLPFSKIAQTYEFFCRDKWQNVARHQVDVQCSGDCFVHNMVNTFCSYGSSCRHGN